MGERAWAWGLVVLLGGCGESAAVGDAGADAARDASAYSPAPPAAPAMTPCPEGWREIEVGPGSTACDPWPASGRRDDCGDDEAHFPGTPGCARIGTACAADGWPTDLPAGATVTFVDDDAAGGDGSSRAAAMTTIGAALAVAAPGTIVAIAAGDYDEDVVVGEGVTLWGACVAGTRITSSRPGTESEPVIHLDGAGSAARNLSVVDAPRPGIEASAGGVVVEDVVLDATAIEAMWVEEGSVALRRVAIRHTALSPTGTLGRGLELRAGGGAILDHVVIEHVRDHALVAGGGPLEARDVAIVETRPRGDGLGGIGLFSRRVQPILLERVAIEGSVFLAVYVRDGATLTARDVVIRDTRTGRDPTLGPGVRGEGLRVENGAHAILERVLVDRSHDVGVFVAIGDTTLEARDLIVRRTEPRDSGLLGRGIVIQQGPTVSLERALVSDSLEAGVFVHTDATLDARDLTVLESMPGADGAFGFGIWGELADLTLTRTRIAVSHVGGISLRVARSTLTDVIVEDTRAGCRRAPCAIEEGGFGLSAHRGSIVTATSFAVRASALCGVAVGSDSADGTASLDLSIGAIEGAPIGACVQVDGYDTSRLRDRVEYRDVDIPLQATRYELPDTLPPP